MTDIKVGDFFPIGSGTYTWPPQPLLMPAIHMCCCAHCPCHIRVTPAISITSTPPFTPVKDEPRYINPYPYQGNW